jgi:hypothetical protein
MRNHTHIIFLVFRRLFGSHRIRGTIKFACPAGYLGHTSLGLSRSCYPHPMARGEEDIPLCHFHHLQVPRDAQAIGIKAIVFVAARARRGAQFGIGILPRPTPHDMPLAVAFRRR